MPSLPSSQLSESLRKCIGASEVDALFGRLEGRVYCVTGASSGFGLETAIALAKQGGTVVLACRQGAKAEAATNKVKAVAINPSQVHLLPLDLSVPSSVRACAAKYNEIRESLPNKGALSALILNAGVLGLPWPSRVEAEPALQTNLLGHALLHELLKTALEQCVDSRLVVVASGSHYSIRGKELDLEKELPPRRENFSPWRAYAFSNLCRILWAKALSTQVRYPVISLHPASGPPTDAGRNLTLGSLFSVLSNVLRFEFRALLEFQSVTKGARTQTFLSVAPIEAVVALNGTFLSGNETDGPLGHPFPASDFAKRDDYAKKVKEFVDAFIKKELVEH